MKFRNLIPVELWNDIKAIVQSEIKKHLKSETLNPGQSVTDSYLKEINNFKEELNKKNLSSKNWLKQ